jgi:futalosine hydrolase
MLLPATFAGMKIVIVAATDLEIRIAREKILPQERFQQIQFLTKIAIEEKPHLIIQAGIAGAFDEDILLGTAVAVKEEILGDLGVEENNEWKDVFDLKLEKDNYPPFEKGKLLNNNINEWNLLKLTEVTGITVNEITTNEKRIQQLKEKYKPSVESMEGAALHYVCRRFGTPFIQLRTVSNYVGERDKTKWMMRKAIEDLNDILLKYVEEYHK